ncbi:hypothetical protein [Streptomyces rishiriensis]|uniref:Uncharacterized protein n=1 Tax=Streptomyces rishiriensis TaxID=68264 RepID=A0ABU0NZC0_STRRH|nr:hypothetical protein [Streptomyces rishiriensis]MDQ0584495.1 hypothetical protein [Streptomyces rishiriensis]
MITSCPVALASTVEVLRPWIPAADGGRPARCRPRTGPQPFGVFLGPAATGMFAAPDASVTVVARVTSGVATVLLPAGTGLQQTSRRYGGVPAAHTTASPPGHSGSGLRHERTH